MPVATPTDLPDTIRLERIDALRGLAMVWMAIFHFCFDLNWFGVIKQNFYHDPVWTVQRTIILSLFLITAGMGQALAQARGQGWPRFWRRWFQIALAAVLVSIGSWFAFPGSWISFGVLHGIAVMLLLSRALMGLRLVREFWILVLLALLLIVSADIGSHYLARGVPQLGAWLDSRWLYGIGWITKKPRTEDYVPLLPWWGVMLIGCALAHGLLRSAWGVRVLSGGVPYPLKWLSTLGRWSLLFYLLHQPILIGILQAWYWLKS
jgi:uncharacterized membrane protein